MVNKRSIAGLSIAGFLIVVLGLLLVGGFGMNSVSDWQVKQSVNGTVSVIDRAGWYPKWFATIYTYPRAFQATPDPIRVTFNDSGEAHIKTMLRFSTPKTAEYRILSHREFGSINNMAAAVQAHLTNCLKACAPLMSASEHQSARKAEFTQLVDNMMRNGIYEMRKVEAIAQDITDEKGNEITVFRTEIITDENGMPVIAQESPLKTYGIEVLQFSVTETEYDQQTRQKFAAKKESFLRAEQSKAEREEEVQQRLMIIERGKRELAEVEAQSNKLKAEQVIEAQRKVEVAAEEKKQATIVAEQRVAVAQLELEEADLLAKAAELKAKATKVIASAREEELIKGGALSERERILAEIQADRDARVASELSKINVPNVVFGGSDGSSQGGGTLENLVNLWLLQSTGIIKPKDISSKDVTPKSNRVYGPAFGMDDA